MFEEKWACGLRCWSVSGRRSAPSYQQPLRTASFGSACREASVRPARGLSRAAWGVPACVCPQEACWVALCLLCSPGLAGGTLGPGSELWDVWCCAVPAPCPCPALLAPCMPSGPETGPSSGHSRRQGSSPSLRPCVGPRGPEAHKGCLRRRGSLVGQGLPPVVQGDISGFFPFRDYLLVVSDGSSASFSLSSMPSWLSGQCWGSLGRGRRKLLARRPSTR